MANATLMSQKVQEIHLINKLEQSGQIQLTAPSLNVSFMSDGSRCGQAPADPAGQRNLPGANSP